MFILFLGLVAIAVWVSRLAGRLTMADLGLKEIEQIAKDARARSDQIARLTARVAALEAAAGQAQPTISPTTTQRPAASMPPVPAVSPQPAQAPAASIAAAVPQLTVPATPAPIPAAPEAVAQRPVAPVPPDTALPNPAPQDTALPNPGPQDTALPNPGPQDTALPNPGPQDTALPNPGPQDSALPNPADEDAWEVTVGGSWLNKIGVLIFVIGLALLIGYSMTHVGPAGRILIGFAVSLSMLATGVVLERRDEYRTYAYGLIAGGWAGTYFTTYAMRAVQAAQILDSDVTAIVALSAVAAAMVWHSLRYRSQEVTALAYVVAYATLALTPLHAFSLAASVPLAVSVLVVAHRFSWPRIQILGIVFTYGLFIMRGQAFGFGGTGATTFTPYLALGAYWIMFEAADLFAVRRRQDTSPAPPPVFLLNAAGLVGSGLLQLPSESPVPLSTFLLVSGAAYLGSAIARAKLSGGASASGDALEGAVRGSHQGASALAVALVAWALELRFTGSRLVAALLTETQLVFLSGLILRDHFTRGIGSALALLVGVHAITLIGAPESVALPWVWTDQGPAAVAALTAVVWYANREWLRSRQIAPLRQEWLFTPAATYLVVLIARAELQMGYSSLAALVFSLVLLEAGLRRGIEYRYQAYAVGAGSAIVLLVWFGGQAYIGAPSDREAWTVLMSAMAVAYLSAWRIAPASGSAEPDRLQRVFAAAVAGALGTAFVVMLEWIVVDPDYVALVWAATATTIGVAGLHWKLGGLRWQLYPLLALALLRALQPVLASPAATSIQIISALVVIGFLYAFSLAVREPLKHSKKTMADVEDAVRMALSVAATLSLASLIYVQVRPTLVTVTWGAQAAVLLATGFPTRERLLRLSGLGVLMACIMRLFVFDLPQLEELARIISFVALGAVLLTVSWIYTRYRARIQKYL